MKRLLKAGAALSFAIGMAGAAHADILIATVGPITGEYASFGAQMKAVAYYTSKAAALHLTRALAAEWGAHGIRVNAICPGFFPSKMSSGLLETISASVIERTPLGRIGGDTDLMGAAVYLASDASRHVTGQYIAVDGGASTV